MRYVLSTSFVMDIIMTTLQTFYILIGEDTKNSLYKRVAQTKMEEDNKKRKFMEKYDY